MTKTLLPPTATPNLAAIETEHGFTFGNPTNDTGTNAPPTINLACTTPTCTRRNNRTELNADTPTPIYCGECGTLLLANPNQTTDASLPTDNTDALNALADAVAANLAARAESTL
jgi:hypothetical protein